MASNYTVEEPSGFSVEEPTGYSVEEAPVGTKALPYRALDYMGKFGQDVLDLLAEPGELAVQTAKKIGVDTDKPSYGLSVPLVPQSQLPPAGTTEQVIRDAAMFGFPAGGLVGAARLGSRLGEKVAPLAEAPVSRIYPSPIGPPPSSSALVQELPGFPLSAKELLTEPETTLPKLGPAFEKGIGGVRRGPAHYAEGPTSSLTGEPTMLGQPVEGPSLEEWVKQKAVIPVRLDPVYQESMAKLEKLDNALTMDLSHKEIAKLPPNWRRIIPSALTSLSRTHPSGEQAASLYLKVLDAGEQQALSSTQSFERSMDTIWGRRAMMHPKQLSLTGHFLTPNTWKIGQKDVDDLVAYLYTGGRVKPTGPNAQKVEETAQAYFQSTQAASSHPGVREMTRFDPITGERLPLGPPDMFFSHLPVGKKAEGLQMRWMNEAWKSWKAQNPQGTRLGFEDWLDKNERGVSGYVGLTKSRLFDAEKYAKEQGISIAAALRKVGYDTDPRRVLFNYLNGAFAAGERKVAEPLFNKYLDDILTSSRDVTTQEWTKVIFKKMTGRDIELADRLIGGVVSDINNLTNFGLMQYSTPMQANQLMYIVQRAGLKNFAKGFIDKQATSLSPASAAVYQDYLQALTIGTNSPFGRALQAELNLNGFIGMDRLLRGWAGQTGVVEAKSAYANLLKEPGNLKYRAIMKELNLDPETILTNGLAEKDMLTAAKRFADETQGRRNLAGLPMWAIDNAPLKRAILNLKNFMLINMSNLHRDLVRARELGLPMKDVGKRAIQGAVAAGAMGEVTKDILYTLTSLDSPFSSFGQKNDKRVPKAYQEFLGPYAGRVVDDIVTGYSTIALSLLTTLMQQDKIAKYEAVLPVSLVTAYRFWDDPGKMALRSVPIIGPTLSKQVYPPKQSGGMTVRPMGELKP